MSQSNKLLVVLCAALALHGVNGSSREFARQLQQSCTTGCSTLLGSASAFGVIAASTIVSNGATIVQGNLALTPGTALNGFPQGNVTGITYVGGAVGVKAAQDAGNAYATLVGLPHNVSADLSGKDLVGVTLTAGKYVFATAAQLSGNLTLDAQGNTSAVFIIQSGTTFITSANSNILLINGARSCNVFFVVGSSATITAGSIIRGSILAHTSITLQHAVSVRGSVVACNAAVTLDFNAIIAPSICGSHPPSGSAPHPPHHHPSPSM